MHTALRSNLFFVNEHFGIFKAATSLDIFDPKSNMKTLERREPNLRLITKFFRFADYKRMTPFHVEVATRTGQKMLSVNSGISLLWFVVQVMAEIDRIVGTFKQQLFSIDDSVPADGNTRMLVLAAVMCIDMVLKE